MRTPIERITARGVVTEDGVTHDADVIVYATGFRHTDVLWPLKVTGHNRNRSAHHVGEPPLRLLGITVPEFPDFFIIYGPGTHLAHGGSLIFQSELQMRYIDQCLQRLDEIGLQNGSQRPKPPSIGINGLRPKSRHGVGAPGGQALG